MLALGWATGGLPVASVTLPPVPGSDFARRPGQDWIGGDRRAQSALAWSSGAAGISWRGWVVGGSRPAGRRGGHRDIWLCAAGKNSSANFWVKFSPTSAPWAPVNVLYT